MFTSIKSIQLVEGATDLRKSIDGLSIIASSHEVDVFDGSIFVFCNRNRNRMKILHWDHNGFWIYLKRLEKGRYKFPENGTGLEEITNREFDRLLQGMKYKKQMGHKAVTQRKLT